MEQDSNGLFLFNFLDFLGFGFLLFAVVGRATLSVVGDIKARPFENYGDGSKETARFTTTSWTIGTTVFPETTLQFKSQAAFLTFVFVDWHHNLLLPQRIQKCLEALYCLGRAIQLPGIVHCQTPVSGKTLSALFTVEVCQPLTTGCRFELMNPAESKDAPLWLLQENADTSDMTK
jgi:hypothetical protein